MDTWAVLILIAGIIAMDTTSGPQVLVSEPIVSCSFLGIIFGIPETGLKMGVLFQLFWLGYMPLGAARLTDGNMAAYISTAGLFTASKLYGFGGEMLNAAVVPAMLYGVIIGNIGMHLTQRLRKLNSRRNGRMCSRLEEGDAVSVTGLHLLGIGSSFSRGVLMALVLIPAGTFLVGCVRMMPLRLVHAFARSSLLIWGTVSAGAVLFFWLKGRKRYFMLGSIGGILWILMIIR